MISTKIIKNDWQKNVLQKRHKKNQFTQKIVATVIKPLILETYEPKIKMSDKNESVDLQMSNNVVAKELFSNVEVGVRDLNLEATMKIEVQQEVELKIPLKAKVTYRMLKWW